MKNTTIKKILLLSTVSLTLSACNGFFDKDNTPTPTPLTALSPEIQTHLLWNKSANDGIGTDYLKMVPVVSEQTLFSADKEGDITALNTVNGQKRWYKSLNVDLSAGPAANANALFVGSRKGNVIALNQADGQPLWQTQLASEILSPPAANNRVVLVKTIDGQLTALAAQDGHILWHYQQTEPLLILRGGSAPQIVDNTTVVGFANGRLVKLALNDGSPLWQQIIAMPQGSFAVQRMVDINADPLVSNGRVYTATYQGKIAVLDLTSGTEIWSHDISSYTGLTVDNERVYVSDATGHLWAFDKATGTVVWRQTQLEARRITGPASFANYIVIGDGEGYLHWLNKQDGHFVARTRANTSGIQTTPVVNNNVVYILTMDGHVAAYTL